MEKLKKALEKNVEWIALGLAGVWLLSLVWMYVISQRASVEINGRTYSPSTVDEAVAREAARLRPMLESQTVPTLPTPKIDEELAAKLNTPSLGEIGPLVLHSPPARAIQAAMDPTQPQLAPEEKVAALPDVPAIKLTEVQSDRDQALVPKIEKPEPGKTPAPMVASPMMRNPMMRPGMSPEYQRAMMMAQARMGMGRPGMTPGMPAVSSMTVMVDPNTPPVDKYWVTVFGKFSEAELDAAFQKVKLPAFLSRRQYMQVQLVRQELMPDGSWGNEKEIPSLPMNASPYDKVKDVDSYEAWVLNSQLVIVQPPFYQTVNTKWAGGPPPKTSAAEVAAAEFDSMSIAEAVKLMTDLERTKYYRDLGLTPAQMGKVSAALRAIKDQEAADKRREKASSERSTSTSDKTPPRLPIVPRGGGTGGRDAQDPSVLREMYAQVRPDDPRMRQGNLPPNYRGAPPGYGRPLPYGPNPYMRPMPAVAGAAAEATQAVVIQPSNKEAGEPPVEFDVWAHDETVEPGKTYRYRMRMKIRNPVYSTNMVKDLALAKPMELPVDKDKGWSEWTKPVEVKPRVAMFLAGGAAGNNNMVRFDVYRWQDGKVNKPAAAIAVTPGDMVGGPDKLGIDYTTGWTLVDIRTVGNDARVTLVDDTGTQRVRHFKADSSDAHRKELEQQHTKQQADAAAAAGIDPAGTGAGTGARPGTNTGNVNILLNRPPR